VFSSAQNSQISLKPAPTRVDHWGEKDTEIYPEAQPKTEPPMRAPTILILALTALLGVGCAQLPQFSSDFIAGLKSPPLELEARGPGAVFDSVEAAAVDALTFSYLQARETGEIARMHAGTIQRSGAGYTYGEIHVASRRLNRQIEYVISGRDVARFHVYPPHADRNVNRSSERLSAKDWRSVNVVDPLHRSLYVLHPSLAIRAYHGDDSKTMEVANLRGPARGWKWPSLFARR
jgi:hypothetical protein